MKKIILLTFSILLLVTSLQAQDRDFKRVSFGFQINNVHGDFGLGLQALSPEFYNLRVSLRGNLNWLNHQNDAQQETWTEYGMIQLGFQYHHMITNRIKLYTEGGMVGLIPNAAFSTDVFKVGGYGVFGFEFLFTEGEGRDWAYFLELGGTGTGARANRTLANQFYATGFLVSVGFRF